MYSLNIGNRVVRVISSDGLVSFLEREKFSLEEQRDILTQAIELKLFSQDGRKYIKTQIQWLNRRIKEECYNDCMDN
jgi:hypothetical protein